VALRQINFGVTETEITGVGTIGARTSEFRVTETGITGVHSMKMEMKIIMKTYDETSMTLTLITIKLVIRTKKSILLTSSQKIFPIAKPIPAIQIDSSTELHIYTYCKHFEK
jgi:hypothetical protein